jgi:hypothetical protein
MADDSDSDSSFGEIPLCDAPEAPNARSAVVAPPPSESLEASTARRETAEAAKREAADAKEREEAQARERARVAAAADAARRREAEAPPADKAPRQPAIQQGSRAPKRKDGKHETFDQKEKRSRKARNECDWNQEEKRILRQQTDGYSLGY